MHVMNEYDGYGWIKVKKYVMDDSKSWPERYAQLEAHHKEETAFLIDKVRELAKQVEGLRHHAEPAVLDDTDYFANQWV